MNVYRYAIVTLGQTSYVSNNCQFSRFGGKIRSIGHTQNIIRAKLFKRERDAKGFLTKGKDLGSLEGAEIVPLYLWWKNPPEGY